MGKNESRIGILFVVMLVSFTIYNIVQWKIAEERRRERIINTRMRYELVREAFGETKPIIGRSKEAESIEKKVCTVTRRTELIRRLRGNILINPEKKVIDDLLEVVVPSNGADTLLLNMCRKKQGDEKIAIVLVKSERSKFNARQVIRKTWGMLRSYEDWKVRIHFLLGQSDFCVRPVSERADETLAKKAFNEEIEIRTESDTYGDLVIGSYTDTYRNLTYKTLTGYNFIMKNCMEADLVIKTDDDMFVDISKVLDVRDEELKKKNKTSSYSLYDVYCDVLHHEVLRQPPKKKWNKWFETREEQRPENMYPVHCVWNEYTIAVEWLLKIFSVRHLVSNFWIDDVYTNGKLRQIAERIYHKRAKVLDLNENVSDLRSTGNATFVMESCKTGKNPLKLKYFVFLNRDKAELNQEEECLWKAVIKRLESRKNKYTLRQE